MEMVMEEARETRPNIPRRKRKSIPFQFGEEHKEYIRRCEKNTFNILEGAVRSGKTIDNVFAFAHELKTTPDKLHLATGSTMANAKMNIGEANGFGLEHIFRGQCRWSHFKGNDALVIRGPDTGYRERVVIFAGGAKANSFEKIRGNSYGMWIATEINLHHDSMIKEAFNRQLAAKRRKVFWDMNPEHPKAHIYTEYIDVYARRAAAGELLGGFNYEHYDIFQNPNISAERLAEITSQYEPGTIWYERDILGKRSIAEGLVYVSLATEVANGEKKFAMAKKDAMNLAKKRLFLQIVVGVDFGGNGSGHAFVATAITEDYEYLVVLRSERYVEGKPGADKNDSERMNDIDPEKLGRLFIRFIERVEKDYGYVSRVYADSAEQVLMRGLRTALADANRGNIKIYNAKKCKINDRIFATTSLTAQDRLRYVEGDCETWEEAVSMAVWDPKKIEWERLDNGTSDIDTMDAFEYSFEKDIPRLLRTKETEKQESARHVPARNRR